MQLVECRTVILRLKDSSPWCWILDIRLWSGVKLSLISDVCKDLCKEAVICLLSNGSRIGEPRNYYEYYEKHNMILYFIMSTRQTSQPMLACLFS